MRSSGRLLSSIQAPQAHLSKTLFVCSTCRQKSRPQTVGVPSNCRNASGSTPFTEKIRRKIWGTDNPPGLADPYGGESFIERALRKRRGKEAVEAKPEPELEPEPEPEPEPVETTPPDEYVAATTWEGLEEVGSLKKWWEEKPTELDRYDRFLTKKLTNEDDILPVLQQVMVEAAVLKELKLPSSLIYDLTYYQHQYHVFYQTKFNQTKTDKPADETLGPLSFPNAKAKEHLVAAFEQIVKIKKLEEKQRLEEKNIPEEEPKEEALAPGVEEDVDGLNPVDHFKKHTKPIWRGKRKPIAPPTSLSVLSIKLEDPMTNFTIFKRTSQLIGHRIPDNIIPISKTVNHLLRHILREFKPKPKKLAESLEQNTPLKSLPNVQIMSRRFTPIDKEKETGRWKVIEEELTRRGLPVTGNIQEGAPRYPKA